MKREYLPVSQQLFNLELYLSTKFDTCRAYMDLIYSAHVKRREHQNKNKGVKVIIERGQTWVSKQYLAKRWHWDKKTVSSFLEKMEKSNFLKIEFVGKNGCNGCLITVLDYDKVYLDGENNINVEEQIENIPMNNMNRGGNLGGKSNSPPPPKTGINSPPYAEYSAESRLDPDTIPTYPDTIPTDPDEKGGKFPTNNNNKYKNDKKTKKTKKSNEISSFLLFLKKNNLPLPETKEIALTMSRIKESFPNASINELREDMYKGGIELTKELLAKIYVEVFCSVFGENIPVENKSRAIASDETVDAVSQTHRPSWVYNYLEVQMLLKKNSFNNIDISKIPKIDTFLKDMPSFGKLEDIYKVIYDVDLEEYLEYENDNDSFLEKALEEKKRKKSRQKTYKSIFETFDYRVSHSHPHDQWKWLQTLEPDIVHYIIVSMSDEKYGYLTQYNNIPDEIQSLRV